jgi:hypothetical protein
MTGIISELSEFSFFAKSFILQVYDVLARHRQKLLNAATGIAYEPNAPLHSALSWTELGRKIWGEPLRWQIFLGTASAFVKAFLHLPAG